MKKVLFKIIIFLICSNTVFSKDVTEILGFQLEFNQSNFIKNLENFNIKNIKDKNTVEKKWKWFWTQDVLEWGDTAYGPKEISDLLFSELLPDGPTVIKVLPITVDRFSYELEYKDLSNSPPFNEIMVNLMCYDGFIDSNQLEKDNPMHLENIRSNYGCEWPFINTISIKVKPGRGIDKPNCKNDLNFYRNYFLNTYDLKSKNGKLRKFIDNDGYDDYLLPNVDNKKGLSSIYLYCFHSDEVAKMSFRVVQNFDELSTAIKLIHKEVLDFAKNNIKNAEKNATSGL